MSFKERALCPCGSGQRRRDCCGGSARAQRLGIRVLAGGAADKSATPGGNWPAARQLAAQQGLRAWELDLLDLGVDEDSPRTLRLVMAGTTVLHVSEVAGPIGTIAMLAALEGAILTAADEVGGFPDEIRLRDAEMAAMLAQRLARWRIRFRTDLGLYGIDALGADLRRLLDPQTVAAPRPPG